MILFNLHLFEDYILHVLPEMMRYALTNQFLDRFFPLLPVVIPISYYMTPEGPRVLLTVGRVVASRRSIAISSAAPRRHRHLGCIGAFSAMIALERIQRFRIGLDQPGTKKTANQKCHPNAIYTVNKDHSKYPAHRIAQDVRVEKQRKGNVI